MLHDQLCIGIAISANVWNPKQMSNSSCFALHLLKALCTGDSGRAISCRPYNTECSHQRTRTVQYEFENEFNRNECARCCQ